MLRITSLIGLWCCTALAAPALRAQDAPRRAGEQARAVDAAFRHPAPSELYEVVRVVDPDTIHVRRNGEIEKLRLLSVDSEEKISGGYQSSDPLKPATVYGEECALWAEEFFAERARDGEPARVGLVFPGGVEARGNYGRLLCHVVLEDGTDFNLMLVEMGISPYFNKYGNSRICHEEMVAAQRVARERQLGIWNPATNRPENAGEPAAVRPYDLLLPWWDARARAIDGYRQRAQSDPDRVVWAERPDELERGVRASQDGDVEVFASIFRIFDEDSGDRTFLMRGDPDRALRIRVSKSALAAFDQLDLAGTTESLKQNYLWVRGRVRASRRGGFEMQADDPGAWRIAEPAGAARD